MSEVFLILPKKFRRTQKYPDTVNDLAAEAHISVERVLRQLRNIYSVSQGIEILADRLVEKLTLRTEDISVLNLSSDLHKFHKALVVDNPNLEYLLKNLRCKNEVVCFCEDGSRSYSAAMYLRSLGMTKSFYLDGGLLGLGKESKKRLIDLLN